MTGHDRSVGVTEALQGALPADGVVLFALLTQLGDVWFLTLLGGALYVAGDALPFSRVDHRRGLFVLALVVTYLALVGVLKQFFLLPRPPGAGEPPVVDWVPVVLDGVLADIATGDGPGFPSGHALGTTMVWGGVALVAGTDSRSTTGLPTGGSRSRTALALAASVVVLVSVSRLVLGVHYLVDVVVGVAVGAVVLAACYRLADGGEAPGRVLLAATAIGAVGLVQTVSFDSVAAAGSAAGAWLVWRAVADATPAQPADQRELGAAAGVFGLAAGLSVLLYALDPPHVLTFLGSAVATGGAVAAPLAGATLTARAGW